MKPAEKNDSGLLNSKPNIQGCLRSTVSGALLGKASFVCFESGAKNRMFSLRKLSWT